MAAKTGSERIAQMSHSVSKGRPNGCSQYSHNFTVTDGQGEPHGNTLCDCKKMRYSEMKGR